MFKVLYLGLLLVAMVRQESKCNETVLHSATSALQHIIARWFPEDTEISEYCVAEGCPTLKDISLCSSGLDVNSLRHLTETMNDCMKGPICGIDFDSRPVPPLAVSMDEFLPGFQIEGILTNSPDNGYLSNISNIEIDISPIQTQEFPLSITMLIPNLRIYGRIQLDLRLETVFGPALTASLSRTTYDVGVEFISTIVVNQTIDGKMFDIRFVNPMVRAKLLFCGIDTPTGFPDIRSLFASTGQLIIERSTMAKALGKFLGRLYRSAIHVILNNCQPANFTA